MVPEKASLEDAGPEEMMSNGVPMVYVEFTNLETPGASFDFAKGPKTLDSIPKGMRYRLEAGKEYLLPLDLIEDLHGLAVPELSWEMDALSGQMVSRVIGQRKRVSLMPTRIRSMTAKVSPEEHDRIEQEVRLKLEAEYRLKMNDELNAKLAELEKEQENRELGIPSKRLPGRPPNPKA